MAPVKFEEITRIHTDCNQHAVWEIFQGTDEVGVYYRAIIKNLPGSPEFSYVLRGHDQERVWFASRGVLLGYTVGCGSTDVSLSYSETF
mgnify:CR=1 FL=1